MSPSQRKRPTSGGGKSKAAAGKGPSSREAARRLGLLVFGVSFLLLFAIVAIAEGIGRSSVPSGDVVLVEGMPGDSGTRSRADFEHALELAAIAAGQKKPPKPGDAQYEELKKTAVGALLDELWLEAEAAERGIAASEKEVAEELKKIKKESFPKESDFKKFIKESGFTDEDVDSRVRLQILSTAIQEELAEDLPTPSQKEIESYYEAAKATQFTQPASRDVRLVRTKDRKKAERALKQLKKDKSAKSWQRVAKEFSEDAATKGNGGLQQGVSEGTLEEAVDKAVFAAPEGRIEGPVKTAQGFYVFEVVSVTPETVQALKEVEDQVDSVLSQRLQQDTFDAFVKGFTARWSSKTVCADGYAIDRCNNFSGSARHPLAPPGCFEASPQGGPPEACPAPVNQLVPALPGSITPLEPRGEPMVQRPQPAGLEETEEGAGLPQGFIPPPTE